MKGWIWARSQSVVSRLSGRCSVHTHSTIASLIARDIRLRVSRDMAGSSWLEYRRERCCIPYAPWVAPRAQAVQAIRPHPSRDVDMQKPAGAVARAGHGGNEIQPAWRLAALVRLACGSPGRA